MSHAKEIAVCAYRQDPKAYIEALLSVHKKYGDVVNGPFRAELGFNASLDRVSWTQAGTQTWADIEACGNFCNKNAAATTATRSPELLASYCDMLLKKSNKDFDAESLEEALNQVVR